jgi:UDP-N-acetylglucosamine 2-epimerase (non-hydrolysing)
MPKARIHLIAAARPNFMKVAPLYHQLAEQDWCETKIVHTGQHYEANMSDAFFDDLGLPTPHYHLGVGSGTHAEQTGGVMIAYEKVCQQDRPDWIVVVGDVNSTAACAMVGAKLWIPVAHLEAGLRSRDRRMPEEINRLITDSLADLLWTPSRDADRNLMAEGVSQERIDFVGNIMIDSYEMLSQRIDAAGTRARLDLQPGHYGVVTLHRPSNVDDPDTLRLLLNQLVEASKAISLVFAVHPRTRKSINRFGLEALIKESTSLRLIEPIGYIEFMNLVKDSALALTDSGGLQEETTYLGIPCLTLRANTERPITVEAGTNRLTRPDEIVTQVHNIKEDRWPGGQVPDLWDGQTAVRVADSLHKRVSQSG